MHGRIDGGAFCTCADVAVFIGNVGQIQAAAHDGFNIALFMGAVFGRLHVFSHSRVASEIAVDEFLRFGRGDFQIVGQTVLAHAVD